VTGMPAGVELFVLDPTTRDDWDTMVSVFPEASFFHSRAWLKVLERSYGYRPVLLVGSCREEPVLILPFLEIRSPLTGCRGVSLPFSDHCPPLISKTAQKIQVEEFLTSLGREKGWKYFEIRGDGALSDGARPLTSYLFHTLNLEPDASVLFKQFRKGTRSTIKKAQREGIVVVGDRAWSSMAEFYRLHCLTRKKHGVPPQPLAFFKELHKQAIEQGSGLVVTAYLKGKSIAAGVFLEFNGAVIYKYGASDTRYQRLGANDLLLFHAISHYCERGCRTLDFGRTSPANEGLARFKSGWGTSVRTVNYFRKNLGTGKFISKGYEKSTLINSVFAHLPAGASRFVGKKLYKHFG